VIYRVFPYVFPLQIQNGMNECFHTAGAVLFHSLGEMAIFVQGESCGSMAKIPLYGFYIIPGTDGIYCIGVPEVMKADAFYIKFCKN
jgi:hypothetical protein